MYDDSFGNGVDMDGNPVLGELSLEALANLQ